PSRSRNSAPDIARQCLSLIACRAPCGLSLSWGEHLTRAQPFRGSSRFEVVAQVGQGGAGYVYEAIDRESNSRVAVKTLRTRDGASILHLKDEFRVIHDLSHPNLVTPKELFEENGQWFFTMDFVE